MFGAGLQLGIGDGSVGLSLLKNAGPTVAGAVRAAVKPGIGRTNLANEHGGAVYGWHASESDDDGGRASTNMSPEMCLDADDVGRKILVAVDDDLVRMMIVAMLEDAGYEVLEASGGLEALALLERREADVAAIVSDIVMPGLDGLALARIVSLRWPRVAVVLVSGYPADGCMSHVSDAVMFVPSILRRGSSFIARMKADSARQRAFGTISGHCQLWLFAPTHARSAATIIPATWLRPGHSPAGWARCLTSESHRPA